MHQSIDWFSWLSQTNLDPSLIYEYGMSFCRNELEEDDIGYFNHEFLQSMGISIAKHRLEILKLARKQKGSSGSSHSISNLMIAIKRTNWRLARYIRTWVHRDHDSSSLVLVRKSYGSGWNGYNMLKRNKRLVSLKQATPTLYLTNGYHMSNSVKVNSFSSPVVNNVKHDQEKKDVVDRYEEDGGGGVGVGVGVGGFKEIKWDTMFQNLKPT